MTARVNLPREERAFEPISGHRVLDLLATLRERHLRPEECLRRPADLDRWLAVAGLDPGRRAGPDDLAAARELRETVNRAVRAVLEGTEPRRGDVRVLNEWARRPQLVPQARRGLGAAWWGGDRPVEAALAVVAREAVELLTGPDRDLIRECSAAPACSRVYLDRSHGRRRRWCHMDWCGASAKMRTYRRRSSAAAG